MKKNQPWFIIFNFLRDQLFLGKDQFFWLPQNLIMKVRKAKHFTQHPTFTILFSILFRVPSSGLGPDLSQIGTFGPDSGVGMPSRGGGGGSAMSRFMDLMVK